MHSHVLSRPMLISMHAHYSLTLLLPLPHTTRCGDAMLAYAAAARLPHAALLHTTTCLDGRVDSVTHRPGSSASCCTQPPSHRPSIAPTEHLRSRARPGAAGVPTGDTATPRPCRVPVADGARRGLTARHHTPRQLGLPPFHREPQRACRPGGPWRAGCRLPRCVTHSSSISISPCIALSASIAHPANRDENCLQRVASAFADPPCVTPPLLPRST